MMLVLLIKSSKAEVVETNAERMYFSMEMLATNIVAGTEIYAYMSVSNGSDGERQIVNERSLGLATAIGDFKIINELTGDILPCILPNGLQAASLGSSFEKIKPGDLKKYGLFQSLNKRYGFTNPGTYLISAKTSFIFSTNASARMLTLETPAIQVTLVPPLGEGNEKTGRGPSLDNSKTTVPSKQESQTVKNPETQKESETPNQLRDNNGQVIQEKIPLQSKSKTFFIVFLCIILLFSLVGIFAFSTRILRGTSRKV